MRECETGTGKSSFVKRVSVRSGGAGHAHSGVAKANTLVARKGANPRKGVKLVKLGR